MPSLCPICSKDDQAHKVSAVYAGGQYELSRSLAPPPEPNPKGSGGGLLAIVVVVASLLLCRLEFGQQSGIVTIAALGIYFLALFILLGVYRRNEKKNLEEHYRVLSEWQNTVMKKWTELYYCERDDCVFDPNTGKSVPRYSMNTLLE